LQCADDMELHYRHCETLLVTEGTQVQVYDKIATLGQTGDVTGPCLSFAVYQNGEPLYLYSVPAYEAR
ncbi:MAG: M23 family metallopeptidase, partial [Peptococcaceae bacterium]|nr:M23 family metallopeptidase [Peptococcaceae bacterium]